MKYFFLTLCLIYFSCHLKTGKSLSPQQFEVELLKDWIYAINIQDLKLTNQEITRPPGINLYLFSLEIPSDDGIGIKTDCVFYKVPYQDLLGELKIISANGKIDCKNISLEKELMLLDGIQKLAINFDNANINMKFHKDKKRYDIKIPLLNINQGKIFSKYSPMSYKKKFSQLTLMKVDQDKFNFANNKFLGSYSDKYSSGKAIRCLKVNESCERVGENRCGQCRYGFYEVADVNCPNGGSRFCGINHCGEKNEPACPRGHKSTNEDEKGICNMGLVAKEDENQILVCH